MSADILTRSVSEAIASVRPRSRFGLVSSREVISDLFLSVMGQLGVAYQSLPDLAMAAYQAESTSLKADVTALNVLIDQIRPLFVSIDAKAQPLDEKNKRAPHTLRGLLRDDADVVLLDQITGPQPQSPAPPPPPNP